MTTFLVDRIHRDLTDEEIPRVAHACHVWRSHPHPSPFPKGEGSRRQGEGYEDIAGFCKSANTDEIAAHGYILTPGRYVGAEEAEEDDERFEEKMKRLTAMLEEQFIEWASSKRQSAKTLRDWAIL